MIIDDEVVINFAFFGLENMKQVKNFAHDAGLRGKLYFACLGISKKMMALLKPGK